MIIHNGITLPELSVQKTMLNNGAPYNIVIYGEIAGVFDGPVYINYSTNKKMYYDPADGKYKLPIETEYYVHVYQDGGDKTDWSMLSHDTTNNDTINITLEANTEFVYSDYNIVNSETNEVLITSSVPYANYLYNDVMLPQLPSDNDDEYPYKFILSVSSQSMGDENIYMLVLSKLPYMVMSQDGTVAMMSSAELEDTSHMVKYIYPITETWEQYNVFMDTQFGYYSMFLINNDAFDGYIYDLVWTNTDLPLNDFSSAEIYLAASDPVPEPDFLIKESTLKAIGDQVRRISGIADKLSTSKMLEIFGNVLSVEGVKF